MLRYLIGSPAASEAPLPHQAELAWWYQLYFATDRGQAGAIVIRNYRWRHGLAAGEPQYDDLERQLAGLPAIAVPAIALEGDANGTPHPDASACASKFPGKYAHRVIDGGVGHNPLQEAPRAFAEAIVDVDS